MSEIPGTVGWERRRAEKAEAERDALAAKCAKLEAALTEANDTPAWEALKLCRTERDALRALLSDAKSWLAMDAPVTIKANIRAALQSTGEKP